MRTKKRLTFWTWAYFGISFEKSRKCLNIWILNWICLAMKFCSDMTSSSSACLIRSWKRIFANCEQLFLSMMYAIVFAISFKAFCSVYVHVHSHRDSWVLKNDRSHLNISLIVWSMFSAFTDSRPYLSSSMLIRKEFKNDIHRFCNNASKTFKSSKKKIDKEVEYLEYYSREEFVLSQIFIWLSQALKLKTNQTKSYLIQK